MKKLFYSIVSVVALMATSCSTDNTPDPDTDKNKPTAGAAVEFSVEGINPMTKVDGAAWESTDKVGIYQYNSNDMVEAENICYNVDGVGETVGLTADDAEAAITFPADGSAVDFWAYYPYQADYNHDAPTFSIADQANADYMEAEKITSQTSGAQKFTFTHQFTKVIFNITYGTELENLDDLVVTINGISTAFDLSSNSATDEDQTITATLSDNNSVASAILLPVTTEATVTFTAGGNTYESVLSETLTAGKQFSYDINIGDPNVEVSFGDATVDPWETVNTTKPEALLTYNDGAYEISTAAQLALFANLVNGGQDNINGRLMNNIDLSTVCSAELGSWKEIGTYSPKKGYTGEFDGKGYTIENLYITDVAHSCAGLFGYAPSATITNVNILNPDITSTSTHVGALVGFAKATHVVGCSVIGGNVTGAKQAGGLVGSHEGGSVTVSCFSTATANGTTDDAYAAGLIGYNADGSDILYCFASDGVIGKSYKQGAESANEDKTIAELQEELTVQLLNNGAVYYNEEYSTDIAKAWVYSAGNYPTVDVTKAPVYTDFATDPDINLINGAYEIKTALGLQKFAEIVNGDEQTANGKLVADIDLSVLESSSWTPIGYYKPSKHAYKGVFDGAGHTVSGLHIDYSGGDSCYGLFSYASAATIKNVTILNPNVSSQGAYVGALVGYSADATKIIGCAVIGGTVSGAGKNVGGLVGSHEGGGSLISCYSTATATGASGVGSAVGFSSATVSACYGLDSNGGAEAKTEAEMQEESFVTLLNAGLDAYDASYEGAWKYNAGGYPTIDPAL